MNHIDEFLSPNFHGVAQQCFVAILLITIVALAVARTKPSLSRVFVLLFATYSGLYAARSLPVSSLLLTLIVAPLWTQALAEARENPNLSLRLRALLSRWQAFTGARGAGRTGLPRPSLAGGCGVSRIAGLCASGQAGLNAMDECALRSQTPAGAGHRCDRATRPSRTDLRARLLGRIPDLPSLPAKQSLR